jgi:DtxR family Mn-dependent transcriptional regulator
MANNELSASLEDYLELICTLMEESDCVKAIELSRRLNVSRASVSEALAKLAKKNLIIYEAHKGIIITPEGLKLAKDVMEKHKVFTNFFEQTLGLDFQEAEENACKIEHVISEKLFNKIKLFNDYCNANLEFTEKFKMEVGCE